MSKNPAKIPALLLLGVFVFFYCGNTLFLHTHEVEGTKIIHSHPYLPSSHHTHSSQAFQHIFGINATLHSMQPGEDSIHELFLTISAELIFNICKISLHPAQKSLLASRAPPYM